jgi:hypothetical protein
MSLKSLIINQFVSSDMSIFLNQSRKFYLPSEVHGAYAFVSIQEAPEMTDVHSIHIAKLFWNIT